MTRVLHTWPAGSYPGRFTRDSAGIVRFAYDTDTSSAPISLSLPRQGATSRRAAAIFLENLLPDSAHPIGNRETPSPELNSSISSTSPS